MIVGLASLVFDTAYAAFFPELITREQYAEGSAKMSMRSSGAELAGTSLGGVIVTALGAPVSIAVNAFTHLVSVVALARIRCAEPRRVHQRLTLGGFGRELGDGVRALLDDRVLRTIGFTSATSYLGGAIVMSAFYIFLYRQLHLSPLVLGLIFGIGNIGIGGAFYAQRIANRFGMHRTLMVLIVIAGGANLLLPLFAPAWPIVTVVAVRLLLTLCGPILEVNQQTIRIARVPPELTGRLSATNRTLVWGMLPVGALVGGYWAPRSASFRRCSSAERSRWARHSGWPDGRLSDAIPRASGLGGGEVVIAPEREWDPDMPMPALLCRRLLRHLTIVAILAALVGAAPSTEPSPAAIDAAVLANFPKKPHTGMSVSIVHDGRLVYAKGFGYRDDGTPDEFIAKDKNYYGLPFARAHAIRTKADARTIYAIGSVTRQFTAAAILLLNERGRLSLDDAVAKYEPDVKAPNLTLRMLLNQRSGLPDMNVLAFMERVRPLARRPDGTFDVQSVTKEIAALPPNFAPDAKFEYSTSNYLILGAIVERVAHEPLAAFFEANIIRPLGMTRTAYGKPAAADDVAIGYRLEEGGAIRRAYPWDLGWLGGAGALTSTVEDVARWNAGLLSHRVLTPASLAQMWHGADAGRGQGSYAMGWIEDALGSHRYLWHNGEVGGFHALNVIFPADDLAFTLLANNQDERPEFLLPSIAALFFPVSGLDRILPRSGKVLVEASAAVGLGAVAIAIVAIVTLRRFVAGGIVSAALALVLGFFAPTIVGFVWAGIIALIPIAAYVAAVRFMPKVIAPPPKKARSR